MAALSKELFQKTEESFQQTQTLQDPRQSPSGSPSSKMAPPVGSRFYDEILIGSSLPRPRDKVNAILVWNAFPAELSIKLCVP